eukprot:8098099-Pyramimonas_sp.AAC.1
MLTVDFFSGTAQWHGHFLEFQKLASLQTSSSQSQARQTCLVHARGGGAAILDQKCSGTLDELTAALAIYPCPCKMCFNPLSQKSGGAAFLVPTGIRGPDDPSVRFQQTTLPRTS